MSDQEPKDPNKGKEDLLIGMEKPIKMVSVIDPG